MKECSKCGETKPLSEFHKHKKGRFGAAAACKQCKTKYRKQYYKENIKKSKQQNKKWAEENKDRCQHSWLQRSYGLSLEQYTEMALEQEYRCACCGTHADNVPKKKLFVDHCHSTGKVRALLCHHCNAAIGHAKEDIEILASMISYLQEHKHDA